jgi:hypothetical protein
MFFAIKIVSYSRRSAALRTKQATALATTLVAVLLEQLDLFTLISLITLRIMATIVF